MSRALQKWSKIGGKGREIRCTNQRTVKCLRMFGRFDCCLTISTDLNIKNETVRGVDTSGSSQAQWKIGETGWKL